MTVADREVVLGDVTLAVRESGAAAGTPVLYFHGTPGSRLELAWADEDVEREQVRLIAFDRPGYGRSSPGPFSLASLADLAMKLADTLGLGRFSTLGWSGGGPFALATAAVGGDRIRSVGVMSGVAPFHHVPGASDDLSEIDKTAVGLLPGDPEKAARTFASGFDGADVLTDVDAMLDAFGPALSERDRRVLADPVIGEAILVDQREGLRQGALGGGWDNVAWIGEWDIDPGSVTCPVHLWYGTDDRMAPPVHAQWLAENLPTASLTMLEGYGHFAPVERLPDMLRELTADAR